MVLQEFTSWILGRDNSSEGHTNSTNTDFDKGQYSEDVYLPEEEVRNIHERIRRCLDEEDAIINQDVDETLRLMRDETEKWYNGQGDNVPQYISEHSNVPENEFVDADYVTEADELVGYCLRLERNNAYLLQLIEKFEQVSFKKRYDELLTSNNKLQQEYMRLKSTSTKIYASYCDILEEIRKFKSENLSLKRKIEQTKEESSTKEMENLRLREESKNLRMTNDNNNHKLSDLRKTLATLQRQIIEKDNEIAKLKGINIATKLKLERAENIILKTQVGNEKKKEPFDIKKGSMGPDLTIEELSHRHLQTPNFGNLTEGSEEKENAIEKNDNDENTGGEIEEQDTIALLMQKYQNKTFVI